jgi:hypothetical protein
MSKKCASAWSTGICLLKVLLLLFVVKKMLLYCLCCCAVFAAVFAEVVSALVVASLLHMLDVLMIITMTGNRMTYSQEFAAAMNAAVDS